jgi:hypothetical protein
VPHVAFKSIWTDDDGMLQVAITAGNSAAMATMEAYIYPDEISRFAAELEQFPTSASHEVTLESGSPDPKWYGHLRLRAHVRDDVGHSAVEVFMDCRVDPPAGALHHFYLRCNPADVNELGRQLNQWISQASRPEVHVEWRDA